MVKAERNAASATTKIDPDLLRKAKQVAALREVKLTDYFDGLIRTAIERDHKKELDKIRGQE